MWQAVVIYEIWVVNTYLLFSVVFQCLKYFIIKFKRIVYDTVLKELPGFWGHETRKQLLKLIKKKQTQRACAQTDKRLGERGVVCEQAM